MLGLERKVSRIRQASRTSPDNYMLTPRHRRGGWWLLPQSLVRDDFSSTMQRPLNLSNMRGKQDAGRQLAYDLRDGKNSLR